MADTDAKTIMAQAQALIDKVRGDLAEGEATFRGMGLDPAKVGPALEALVSDESRAKADSAVRADLEAIEQEVQEGKARLAFSAPAAAPARRPRPMV